MEHQTPRRQGGGRCSRLHRPLGRAGSRRRGGSRCPRPRRSWLARRRATWPCQPWAEAAHPGRPPRATSQTAVSRLGRSTGERYTVRPILGLGSQSRQPQRRGKPAPAVRKPVRLIDPRSWGMIEGRLFGFGAIGGSLGIPPKHEPREAAITPMLSPIQSGSPTRFAESASPTCPHDPRLICADPAGRCPRAWRALLGSGKGIAKGHP